MGGDGPHLRFCGFVGDEAHRRRTVTLRHALGRAVIHLGPHRHGATEVARGTRQNLIVWGKRAAEPDESRGSSGDARLHPSELSADVECLSWSHDHDYDEQYAARGLELPPAAKEYRAKERAQAELIDLASRATDEHIEALPPDHRPIVRLLRQAAQQEQRGRSGGSDRG